MESPKTAVRERLRSWASAHGVAVDADDYTFTLEDNLFAPMSPVTRSEFEGGSGGELGSPGKRGKMAALHSSSALACNVFVHWRDRDASVLTAALGLDSDVAGVRFERQFPTGLAGIPPNLDVVLTLADGSIVAIESKFLEPYGGRHPAGFRPKYFESERGLWVSHGYVECQRLASRLSSGEVAFRWLHAEQLLKHILGLAASGCSWELVYLWYAVPGEPGLEHAAEADEFARVAAADGIAFRSVSYQELFAAMTRAGDASASEYLAYLGGRYFASGV